MGVVAAMSKVVGGDIPRMPAIAYSNPAGPWNEHERLVPSGYFVKTAGHNSQSGSERWEELEFAPHTWECRLICGLSNLNSLS